MTVSGGSILFIHQNLPAQFGGLAAWLAKAGWDVRFATGREVPGDAEVLTYLARGMEPMRGFPEMMKVVERLQKLRPGLHAIIVGSDRIAYGQKGHVKSWKEKMLAETALDLSRVHFTGRVSRRDMIRIFRLSDVHLYLSVPFVLSWSALEALSCGCLVVAADNAPVREFMTDGETGLLADPADIGAIADRVTEALDRKPDFAPLRRAARRAIVERLDAARVIFPAKRVFFERLLRG